MSQAVRRSLMIVLMSLASAAQSETLRHPLTLGQQLKASDVPALAIAARRRGDAKRGALLYYRSGAGCVNCHGKGETITPLGPDLAKLGKVTDEHVVESLIHPSRTIRKGYETVSVLTTSGNVFAGLKVKEDSSALTMRLASDLLNDFAISKDDIEAVKPGTTSLMPDGLVGSLPGQREFLDLARYVMEVAARGEKGAAELKPSAEQLAVRDDSKDLDHAGIIKGLRSRDFEAGKRIFHGYCFNCHGNDGNTPSLPTARAFGTQKLKFGSDPYRMFMTLTKGNGLMAPMSHLIPKERYQVVHYIREQFMKPSNSDYFQVDRDYLVGLPTGTKDGTEVENVDRDFGPALASQLERRFSSVINVKMADLTISYDLHSMDQADIWRDGFLDLSDTQHVRPRGEGTANPDGKILSGLSGWRWGHDGTLDYSREGLLPRGPMPEKWMDYRGHYLHGDRLVLHYEIDKRDILELPTEEPFENSMRHSLQVGPGAELLLSVAEMGPDSIRMVVPFDLKQRSANQGAASDGIAVVASGDASRVKDFSAAGVSGDIEGMTWKVDRKGRLTLKIPADENVRRVDITRMAGNGETALISFRDRVASRQQAGSVGDPAAMTGGGPERWPQVLTTQGYLGLERGAYVLDTITIPESTPWNTWFRTSALDFFPDGSMVVATHGGDIWVVTGVDDQLLELKWKRFAGGLYEPFGVKVHDGKILVTCKDRLTRLHDIDGNGEADYYESFSADQDVSVNFHAFNFDLQTDADGNFFYSKSGHGTDSEIPGAVIKVSADGKKREVYCTGFRTPNGMGSLPDGRVTASDNQGQWTPASKVSLLRRGGFYGWVGNYSIPGKWEPGGGSIDLKKVVPPKSFDPPLVWMPQEFDNSSGGQIWVDDSRFGPLSGRLFHTSFGKGWMYYMMIQDLDEASQAAIIKLPFDFRTGIMRGRVNPADGQVYATGLQGWNGGARQGLLDKGIQRLRYTGKPIRMVSDCKVEPEGLRLSFNFELDPDSATDLGSYDVTHWNYHWRQAYGSDMYSPTTDKPGIEKVGVVSASLGSEGRSVLLQVPDLKPVDQVHLLIKIKAASGDGFEEEVYWTINQVPKK